LLHLPKEGGRPGHPPRSQSGETLRRRLRRRPLLLSRRRGPLRGGHLEVLFLQTKEVHGQIQTKTPMSPESLSQLSPTLLQTVDQGVAVRQEVVCHRIARDRDSLGLACQWGLEVQVRTTLTCRQVLDRACPTTPGVQGETCPTGLPTQIPHTRVDLKRKGQNPLLPQTTLAHLPHRKMPRNLPGPREHHSPGL